MTSSWALSVITPVTGCSRSLHSLVTSVRTHQGFYRFEYISYAANPPQQISSHQLIRLPPHTMCNGWWYKHVHWHKIGFFNRMYNKRNRCIKLTTSSTTVRILVWIIVQLPLGSMGYNKPNRLVRPFVTTFSQGPFSLFNIYPTEYIRDIALCCNRHNSYIRIVYVTRI